MRQEELSSFKAFTRSLSSWGKQPETAAHANRLDLYNAGHSHLTIMGFTTVKSTRQHTHAVSHRRLPIMVFDKAAQLERFSQ